jgi:alkylation response protein AidB-like acyl-CoA dehydrogenase
MELDGVVVPTENMLGQENQGFEIIMSSTYYLNPDIAAMDSNPKSPAISLRA